MNFAKLRETIQIALSQLSVNKLRSALTMLGITIGVASVIVLVSVGKGVEDFIISQFDMFGSRMIFAFTIQNERQAQQTGQRVGDGLIIESALTLSDYDVLTNKSLVPDASEVAYTLSVNDPLVYQGEAHGLVITGISSGFPQVMQLTIAQGRLISEDDILRSELVAVVGEEVVEDVFDGRNPIGEPVRIGDETFRIIGVLEEMSADFPGLSSNDSVFIPVTTAQQRLSGGRTLSGDFPVTGFMLQARSEEVAGDVVLQVRRALRAAHNTPEGEEADFRVMAQQTITDVLSSILGLLTVFLSSIAGISLVVGGIGIMNIMLVTVTERTREIGLRKAVGARESDILMQFIIESVTLSAIGGIIGTILAIAFSMLITVVVPDLEVTVNVGSVIFAAGISIAIGVFFGAFPASRAAALNPIDALRYE
jgi:putative ABC transport system permease protein